MAAQENNNDDYPVELYSILSCEQGRNMIAETQGLIMSSREFCYENAANCFQLQLVAEMAKDYDDEEMITLKRIAYKQSNLKLKICGASIKLAVKTIERLLKDFKEVSLELMELQREASNDIKAVAIGGKGYKKQNKWLNGDGEAEGQGAYALIAEDAQQFVNDIENHIGTIKRFIAATGGNEETARKTIISFEKLMDSWASKKPTPPEPTPPPPPQQPKKKGKKGRKKK